MKSMELILPGGSPSMNSFNCSCAASLSFQAVTTSWSYRPLGRTSLALSSSSSFCKRRKTNYKYTTPPLSSCYYCNKVLKQMHINMYCTVLYCTVLYCSTVLYCTVLYCTVLYCEYLSILTDTLASDTSGGSPTPPIAPPLLFPLPAPPPPPPPPLLAVADLGGAFLAGASLGLAVASVDALASFFGA